MANGQVQDIHPIDQNNRGGAAAYIKEAGAWGPWDGSSKNKVWDTNSLSWVSMTQPGATASADPLGDYHIADTDAGSPSYYGFTRANGSWYIMKADSGSYRYAAGSSGYSTAWTNRGSQTYDYFDVTF